jgi:sn-glycerol 3-phosphate transport system ATP-binding protein
VGIRPEHFSLAQDDEGTIKMKVDHLETLGADTLVHGKSGEGSSLFTLRLPDIHDFQKGSSLRLSVPPERLHLFDKDSGKRIRD